MRNRINCYKKNQFIKQRKFYAAVQKYGLENFTCYKVMDCCPSKVALNYWETYWIKALGTYGVNGYNLTSGGDTCYTRSAETREKLRNRLVTIEWRNKLSKSCSGRVIDEKWRRNISEHTKVAMKRPDVVEHIRSAGLLRRGIPLSVLRRGIPLSENARIKIGNYHRGKSKRPDSIMKMKLAKQGNMNPRYGITESESTRLKKRHSMLITHGTLWKEFFIYE